MQGEPEEFEEDQGEEESRMEGETIQVNKNDPLFHIFRMIIFLYEDLRYKLINIIDQNLNVDTILSEEFVDLIKRQQDIIDEYLKIFNLKKNINFEVDKDNVNKFQFEGKDPKFLEKFFKINKDALKQGQSSTQNTDFNKQKILQKLKIEREIVEQRILELKNFL